jgi:hypothetical protein
MVTTAPGVIGEGEIEDTKTLPATVVTENEIGVIGPAVALSVLVPAEVPVVNLVATRPCASLAAVAGEAWPPPAAMLKITSSATRGFPKASRTTNRTESPAGAPGVTVPGSALVLVSEATAPATTVTETLALMVPMDAEIVAPPTGPTAETCP